MAQSSPSQGSCQVCKDAAKTSLQGRIVFSADDRMMISTKEWTAARIDKFLKSMNALWNSGGGIITIHANKPYLLTKFDERVDDTLQKLVTDNSCFTDNFDRYYHPDKMHIVFRVKHKQRDLSTFYPNIKLSLDKGLADPTQGQLRNLVDCACSEETGKGEEEREEDPRTEKMEFTFTAGQEVDVKDNKGVFQESRNLQAKRVVFKKKEQSKSLDTILPDKMWEELRLPEYISALGRCQGGGSVFYGVREENKEGKPKWEEVTQNDCKDVFVLSRLDPTFSIWKNKHGFCVAQKSDVPKEEEETGRFIVEGIPLAGNTFVQLRREIRERAKNEMVWFSLRGPVELPVEVIQRKVEVPEGKKHQGVKGQNVGSGETSGDVFVIEVKIEYFHGLHQSESLTAKAKGSDKYTVFVEGNIGSGKTTLLDYFRTKPGVEVILEPVEMWRNVRGHNIYEQMFQNPSRWSTTMQTYVQLTMLDIHTRPQKEPVRMMERSIHSARYCFVENLHNSGNMSDIEFVILDEWYQWILKSQDVHADLIIYLYTSPETCHERIMKRCRREETGISLELLQNLHKLHEDWLKHKRFPLQAPVLVLEADCNLSSMYEKYREHEDGIMRMKAAS